MGNPLLFLLDCCIVATDWSEYNLYLGISRAGWGNSICKKKKISEIRKFDYDPHDQAFFVLFALKKNPAKNNINSDPMNSGIVSYARSPLYLHWSSHPLAEFLVTCMNKTLPKIKKTMYFINFVIKKRRLINRTASTQFPNCCLPQFVPRQGTAILVLL